MKATIETIAKQCGVSKATVSYVLNNKKSSLGLSPQTIEKVLKVSRELNYRPDLVAVALAEKKNLPLSLLILTPWLYAQFSDFMAQVNAVMKDYADEYLLKTVYELYEIGDLAKILKSPRCAKFDAVLVIGTSDQDNQFLVRSRENLKNVVLLNRDVPGFPCAGGNDREAAAELAERIIAAGYYEQFIICNNSSATCCEQERIGGFAEALRKNADIEPVFYNLEPALPAEAQMMRLLAERDGKRSLYFMTQYYPAAQLNGIATRRGIRVPEEIGIAAYDNHSLLKEFVKPALTTIDPKIREMTLEALRLARCLKDGTKAKGRIIEGTFVPGESAIHI